MSYQELQRKINNDLYEKEMEMEREKDNKSKRYKLKRQTENDKKNVKETENAGKVGKERAQR